MTVNYRLLAFLILCSITIFKPPFEYHLANSLIIITSFLILLLVEIKEIKFKIADLAIIFISLLSFFLSKSYAGPLILFTFLIFIRLKAESNTYLDEKTKFIVLALVAISLFSLHESHLDRYSTINGDPNYTALITIFPILIIISCSSKKFIVFFCYFLVLFILYATASRTALLATLLYLICAFLKNKLIKKFILISVLLTSILAQPILAFFLLANFENSLANEGSRFLNFYDSSNLDRLDSYLKAAEFVMRIENWTGVRYYMEANHSASNIPHNWFMQIAISNGLPFAIFSSIILIIFSLNLKIQHTPFLIFLLTFATILSIYPLLIMLSIYTLSLKRNN